MTEIIDEFDGRRCISFTKKGTRCKSYRQYGIRYCRNHNHNKSFITTCKGTTKKGLRCKLVGSVYCGFHIDQDWTKKICTSFTNKQHPCTRIRTSPKFCNVHTDEDVNYWIIMYYGGVPSTGCINFSTYFIGVGIFTSLSHTEKAVDEKMEDVVPNQIRGTTFSIVTFHKEDIKCIQLLTEKITPLNVDLINIVNDFIGRNHIVIKCIKGPGINNCRITLSENFKEKSAYCIERNKIHKVHRLTDLPNQKYDF